MFIASNFRVTIRLSSALCSRSSSASHAVRTHNQRSRYAYPFVAPAVAVELAVSGVVPRVVQHLRSPDAIMQKKALGLIALLAQEAKARESLHDLDFSLLTQFLGAENQKLQSMACSTHSFSFVCCIFFFCICIVLTAS